MLDHRLVEEFHADIAPRGGVFFLTNHYPNNGLRVNGQSVKKILLKDSDVIDIGPFSMVFKPMGPAAPATRREEKVVSTKARKRVVESPGENGGERPGDWFDDTFAVVLDNEYEDTSDQEKVAEKLGALFKKSPDRMLQLLSRPGQVVKKDVSYESAKRLQQLLEMAGAGCELKTMEAMGRRLPEAESATAPAAEKERRVVDPDEDDEDDLPANFNLKDRLLDSKEGARRIGEPNGRFQLEVIKSIGHRVVDVQYIGKGRKYRVDGEKSRLRLAAMSSGNRGSVSFPGTWKGYLLSNGQQETLESYKTEKYLHRKRGRLYRLNISRGDTVALVNGACEYQVRHTLVNESPAVVKRPKVQDVTWRHWGASTGFHFIFVMIACIVFAVSSRLPEEEILHFVKVDMSSFEQQSMQAPEVKETPKQAAPVEKPVEKPEPVRVEPAKKTSEIKKTVAKKTVNSTPTADAGASGGSDGADTRHPDAGGGFGEGNIVNRNINQTGLLSMLGDSAATKASSSAVIAEATNLDAVAVPGASDKQFSVGGIKGSLGTGKITLASGQAVQTKGSSQVLRSAGVEGPGTVAALERGEIGNKQVKGMVTAKMTQTVSIQGGMSREIVKQVIDRHLDEIQYCYESALLENSAIMGRIVYEWKILLSGKVGEVRIASSTVNSHQIHDCIKASIKSWQFPKPVGMEVVVSYPFVFDLVGF